MQAGHSIGSRSTARRWSFASGLVSSFMINDSVRCYLFFPAVFVIWADFSHRYSSRKDLTQRTMSRDGDNQLGGEKDTVVKLASSPTTINLVCQR